MIQSHQINKAGRPAGAKNKIQVAVKSAIEQAFNELGGAAYLVGLGQDKPEVFCHLLAKIIPKEVSMTLTNLAEELEEARKRALENKK